MTQNTDDFPRWKHLLFAADSLSSLRKDASLRKEVKKILNSLDEHFPRTLDPIVDFRAYAIRQFCKSMSQIIEKFD